MAPRTTSEAEQPPTTEIRARSSTEMVSSTPRATATTLATTASSSESTSVRTSDATTFWPISGAGPQRQAEGAHVDGRAQRLPSAEKTLPRKPMAAGTSTSSRAGARRCR